LIDRPSDEAFLRDKVEDVVLVDPGRHDEERPLVHFFRARAVLNELDELVLEHDLAGRDREILADLERRQIGLADAQQILRLLEIVGEMRHALHQIRRVGGERGPHHFGVSEGEIRRREGGKHLLEIEQGALLGLVVDAFGLAREVLGPARRQQISLFPEIEELGIRPVRVLEAIVAGLRLDHRLHVLFAEIAANRAAPKLGIILEELVLRRGKLAWVAHPLPGNLAERLGRLAGFRRHAVGTGAVAALGESAEHLGALIEQAHHVAGKRVPLTDLLLFCCWPCDGLVLFLHERSRPCFTPG
jgi:hypothetical protein